MKYYTLLLLIVLTFGCQQREPEQVETTALEMKKQAIKTPDTMSGTNEFVRKPNSSLKSEVVHSHANINVISNSIIAQLAQLNMTNNVPNPYNDSPYVLEARRRFQEAELKKALDALPRIPSSTPMKIEPTKELRALAASVTNTFYNGGPICEAPQTLEEARTLLNKYVSMTRIPIRWFEANEIYYFYGEIDRKTGEANDVFSSGLAMKKGETAVYQWTAEPSK